MEEVEVQLHTFLTLDLDVRDLITFRFVSEADK